MGAGVRGVLEVISFEVKLRFLILLIQKDCLNHYYISEFFPHAKLHTSVLNTTDHIITRASFGEMFSLIFASILNFFDTEL